MALRVVGTDLIPMDTSTYMWIQVVHFAIGVAESDSAILTSLVESPGFAHDYASPYPSSHPELTSQSVHGRWWLHAISSNRYWTTTADEVKADLDRWANEQDWVDPEYRQPSDVMDRLQMVYSLLQTGTVYKLRKPEPEDERANYRT